MLSSRSLHRRLGLLVGLIAALLLIYQAQRFFGAFRELGGPAAMEPVAHEGAGAIAFAPGGRYLVSVDLGGGVKRWPLGGGPPERVSLYGRGFYRADIRAVALDSRADLCTAVTSDAAYALRLTGSGGAQRVPGVVRTRPSSNGRYLVGLTTDGGSAVVFDAQQGRLTAQIGAPDSSQILDADISPDGRLMSLSDGNRLWVVVLRGGSVRTLVDGSYRRASSARFSVGGDLLGAQMHEVGRDGWVFRTWRTGGWQVQDACRIDNGRRLLGFDPGGRHIAVSVPARRHYVVSSLGIERRSEYVEVLQVFDLDSGRPVFDWSDPERVRGHRDVVLACAWSPEGKTVATLDAGGRIALWDAELGGFLRFLRG